MNELGNESKIHNGSILLLPPRGKQKTSPPDPIASFKSSSLIRHKQKRRKERTTKDLSDSVKDFKLVRLISPEERSHLERPFNVSASHINKTEKSNNKVPASCNHSSSETVAEQKVNAPD